MKNDANMQKILYILKIIPFEMFNRLYWAFHISEGTFFNYCKIQVNNHPKNTLRKIY